MKPFFCYYGGKYRAAPHYPKPLCDVIVEPFAGAAGYATRYYTRDVFLYEKDPKIAEMWRWLIGASRQDVLDLPLMGPNDCVDDLDAPDGAKYLIGFWLNKGVAQPCKRPSAWMRGGTHASSFWGKEIRERIASQVPQIKHWRLIEADWIEEADADDPEATWFVDPPYQVAGKHYKMGAKQIDFPRLGILCRQRRGQVIVCENAGANWLPFEPFRNIKDMHGVSREVIFYRENFEDKS